MTQKIKQVIKAKKLILRPRKVTVRFSEEEQNMLKEQADIAALSVSEYIRRRIIGKRVVSKLDIRVLAEVRRLGGLLKHIHVESGGMYSKDTAAALRAVESYIRAAAKQKNDNQRNT